MSKTWHGKKARQANIEGRTHHAHGPNDVCFFCGNKQKGGESKRKRAVVLDELARMGNQPHRIIGLLLDNEGGE